MTVTRLAQVLDSVALVGMILGFILAVMLWLRQPRTASNLAAMLFVLSALLVSEGKFWDSVFGYSRPFSPMLVIVALMGLRSPKEMWLRLLPFAMVDLRVFLQLGPQILGIFGWKA